MSRKKVRCVLFYLFIVNNNSLLQFNNKFIIGIGNCNLINVRLGVGLIGLSARLVRDAYGWATCHCLTCIPCTLGTKYPWHLR